MPKLQDITGQRFGRLRAIKRYADSRWRWLCQCDCGRRIVVAYGSLYNMRSCGCLRKHGGSKTRLYSAWASMRQRCENPHSASYRDYGGRGVKVCDAWRSFVEYQTDILARIGPRPPGMSLDRWPDPDGNYEPGNVRWATPKQQRANRRARR